MKPYLLGPEEGESIWMFDALDTIKADADRTGGAFSVFEFLDFEGSTVPLHAHNGFDRGFYVLDGEYTFVIGTNTTRVSPGHGCLCHGMFHTRGAAIHPKDLSST